MPYSTEDIAKAGRTTLRGARLWDNSNMFEGVERDKFGARVFTDEHLKRAAIIGAAQMAGMSLREIKAAHPATLYSAIRGAQIFLHRVVKTMPSEFDL